MVGGHSKLKWATFSKWCRNLRGLAMAKVGVNIYFSLLFNISLFDFIRLIHFEAMPNFPPPLPPENLKTIHAVFWSIEGGRKLENWLKMVCFMLNFYYFSIIGSWQTKMSHLVWKISCSLKFFISSFTFPHFILVWQK